MAGGEGEPQVASGQDVVGGEEGASLDHLRRRPIHGSAFQPPLCPPQHQGIPCNVLVVRWARDMH